MILDQRRAAEQAAHQRGQAPGVDLAGRARAIARLQGRGTEVPANAELPHVGFGKVLEKELAARYIKKEGSGQKTGAPKTEVAKLARSPRDTTTVAEEFDVPVVV